MDDSVSPGAATGFEGTFNGEVKDALLEALGNAYETARDAYMPERGSNESTFGFGVYHHVVHELSQLTPHLANVQIISRQPSFRMTVGGYELCCHRVGRSETDSIWSSFPNPESAAHSMIEEQLWLPGVQRDVGIGLAKRLVLAHMGNSEEGLRAAYLCVPSKANGSRIVAWASAQTLWRADEAMLASSESSARAPEEVISKPTVRRRVKKLQANEKAE